MPARTAARRRDDDGVAYNAFVATCPTRQLLDTLGSKWSCLVLCALVAAGGPLRYNELSRRIAGISEKMLTRTLRTLQRDGIVTRTIGAKVPVQVDYYLTNLGHELAPVLIETKRWAEAHMDDVVAARSRYDAAFAVGALGRPPVRRVRR